MATPSEAEIQLKRLIAPCKRDCPAGIDVPRYIGFVEKGMFSEATAVVRERIPFPLVCGYVCYRPCEAKCRRASMDTPVAITAIKRAAAERDEQVWRKNWQATIAQPTGKRVAIVGSGPAGLSAAYYLGKRCGHDVTVFESQPEAGGQLRIGIPVYRLPRKVVDAEIALITETRVQIETDHRVNSLDELQGFDAILLGMGTANCQRLGVDGQDLPGVMECVEFLQQVNLGQEASVGNRVAVIGGGNVAIDGARTALRLGAQEVTIVYRRTRAEMPGYDFEVHAAEEEGVKLMFLGSPVNIRQEGDHLILHLQRMQLGEPDSSGRRRPVPIPGDEFDMPIESLLVAIGQVADDYKDWSLDLNQDGTITADHDATTTSADGVFAGGDVATGAINIIEAIAAGRRAAVAIDKYLGGDGDISETLASTGAEMEYPSPFESQGTNVTPMAELEAPERARSWDEVELGYTEEEAFKEARRCIRCDLWRIHGIPSVWPKGQKT
ncbi:MAG: FAD-dependent oxidoreductase [Dehalococcoidia bacterium]